MKKSLAQSNAYLRDPATRERLVYRSVASSSAVEGIRAPFRHKANIVANRASKSIRKSSR